MPEKVPPKRPVEVQDAPAAQRPQAAQPDLGGAAIIDEEGVEIPLTEAMIRQALDELDRAWQRERRRRDEARRPRSRER